MRMTFISSLHNDAVDNFAYICIYYQTILAEMILYQNLTFHVSPREVGFEEGDTKHAFILSK